MKKLKVNGSKYLKVAFKQSEFLRTSGSWSDRALKQTI